MPSKKTATVMKKIREVRWTGFGEVKTTTEETIISLDVKKDPTVLPL